MNSVTHLTTEVVLDGLCFPESPRWHEGRLWFSDMHGQSVMTLGHDGRAREVFSLATQPSGLGWLADGRLLVVSMFDRSLLCFENGALSRVADLAHLARFHCNDMVVDARGRAYIGNFGYDFEEHAPCQLAGLIRVDPDGSSRIVANDLLFPNGTVITPDGRTLIVAETMAKRLTAFRVAEDGSLHERRIWAEFENATPDGICLDAKGAIWIASPSSAEVLRVEEKGHITHRVPVKTQAIACMLGGQDRRTLFVLTAPLKRAAKTRALRQGCIETVRVETPGAGLP